MSPRALLAGAFVGLLAGCGGLPEIEQAVDDDLAAIESVRAASQGREASARAAFTFESHQLWLGARAVRAPRGDPLPSALHGGAVALTVASGPIGEPSKARLVDAVSEITGLPIVVDPVTRRLAERLARSSSVASGDASGAEPLAAGAARPRESVSDVDIASGGFLEGRLGADFVFEGTPAALVARTAEALGFPSWFFAGGTVWLVKHELRELPLHVLAADASSERLKQAVDSLKRACGDCDVEAVPTLGTVHVTAMPAMMRRVESWLGDLNRRLTEQFAVQLSVYAVTRTTSRDFSLDFDLLFGDALPDNEDAFRGVGAGQEGASLVILPRGFLRNSRITIPTLLSKMGRTSRVYSTTFVTLNGAPQQVRQHRDSEIVIGVDSTETSSTGSTSRSDAERTETVTDGFEIEVTALSLGHDRVLLSYRFALQDQLYPQPGTSPEALAPVLRSDVLKRDLANTVPLELGSTLMFNAFDVSSSTSSRSGSATPDLWLPEGGVSGSRTVTSFVVTLRCVSLKAPRPSFGADQAPVALPVPAFSASRGAEPVAGADAQAIPVGVASPPSLPSALLRR